MFHSPTILLFRACADGMGNDRKALIKIQAYFIESVKY